MGEKGKGLHEIVGNTGKLFKDPVLNKKPVLHLGFANSLIHLASAFFLISASYLQIATWAGTVLNCKGLGNSGDQPTLHNSYVNNDCLNNPSLRLISPNQDSKDWDQYRLFKEDGAYWHNSKEATDEERTKLLRLWPRVNMSFRYTALIMLVQFVLCAASYKLWIILEDNHIYYLTYNLRGERIDSEDLDKIVRPIILYFKNFEQNVNYFGRYLFASLVTVFTAVAQAAYYLYHLNWIPFGEAKNIYSASDVLSWIRQEDSERTDTLIKVFPRRVGCDMRMYGPSGTRQFQDFLCDISINNASEKIHLIGLLVLTILAIALILNFIYTFINLTCLIYGGPENSRYRKAFLPLNIDQRLLLLLMHKNVGVNVKNRVLEELGKNHTKLFATAKNKPKVISKNGVDLTGLPV